MKKILSVILAMLTLINVVFLGSGSALAATNDLSKYYSNVVCSTDKFIEVKYIKDISGGCEVNVKLNGEYKEIKYCGLTSFNSYTNEDYRCQPLYLDDNNNAQLSFLIEMDSPQPIFYIWLKDNNDISHTVTFGVINNEITKYRKFGVCQQSGINGVANKYWTGKNVFQNNVSVVCPKDWDTQSALYNTYYLNNKNVGKAYIIFSGTGQWLGCATRTFKIYPKSTTLKSLKAYKRSFKATWKKFTTQTTGYQLQYAKNKKFKSAKTITINKNTTTSKKLTKLSSKKRYYVRVRTYKTVNGIKYYSKWSNVRSVVTK